jgi:predicted permease
MVYAAIAPQAMLRSTFGESVDGPLAELVVRNWGALIFLIGVMLIYGAFNAAVRPLVLLVAAASKVVFIALVLSNGDRYLQTQAGISIAVDSVMVVIFLAYLATRRPATPG